MWREGPASRGSAGSDPWRRTRQAIVARLGERRAEIEEELLTRVYSAPGSEKLDQEYAEGLRGAVRVALEFGLEGIGAADPTALPIPMALREQARAAARNGIDLETVLERYAAGYDVLEGFLLEEIGNSGPIAGADLKWLNDAKGALFERLREVVRGEYRQEASRRPASTQDRNAEIAKRVLAGKFANTAELSYEFDDAFHVAAIAQGTGAASALKGLGGVLGCRLFLVPRGEATVWAWFGNRERHDLERARALIDSRWPAQIPLGIGEAEFGKSGWRRSHRQADAAFGVATRRRTFFRYADDPLLATCVRDDVLARSLRDLYLAPLSDLRDGGSGHRRTLRAYIAANRNGSSAAEAVGVRRTTVTRRLREVEERIGRPLTECFAELEVALRLDELDDVSPTET